MLRDLLERLCMRPLVVSSVLGAVLSVAAAMPWQILSRERVESEAAHTESSVDIWQVTGAAILKGSVAGFIIGLGWCQHRSRSAASPAVDREVPPDGRA